MRSFFVILAFGINLAIAHNGAMAQSFEAALAEAYKNNPNLLVARTQLRALNETYRIAASAGLPTINGSVSQSFSKTRRNNLSDLHSNTGTATLSITQSLYRGNRTRHEVASAEQNIFATRAELKSQEQSILLAASLVYLDVIRDEAILNYLESSLEFYDEQIRAAKARAEVGENTRTDIAFAEARQRAALSSFYRAEATLLSSKAAFQQIIGFAPKKLRIPKFNANAYLPASVKSALNRALHNHPAILSAQHGEDAARESLAAVEGELLPSISVTGSVSKNWNDDVGTLTITNSSSSTSIVGNITIPIFQGGRTHARVRQAKASLASATLQKDVVRHQIRAELVDAWGQLSSAKASLTASKRQVQATEVALQGVVEEQNLGQRTTLDVLNTRSDLVDAQVSFAQASRNKAVASFSLLAAMGILTPHTLKLPVETFAADIDYNNTKSKYLGLN